MPKIINSTAELLTINPITGLPTINPITGLPTIDPIAGLYSDLLTNHSIPLLQASHNQIVEEISQPVNLDKVNEMHEKARSLSSNITGLGYHSAEEKDKLDEAVRILNKAIDLENILTASPRDFGIEELKDSDQISGLKKVLWLRFDRGYCHLMSGNYDKAVEDFTAELSLHENGPGVYRSLYERANAYMMMGRYDLAIDDFIAAKNIEGVDREIIFFSDYEIAEINSKNTNTIWNNAAKSAKSLRSFFTNLSVPTSILGLQKPIENEFLELGDEKIGKIFNQIFDLKKNDSLEFSQFLKELDIDAESSVSKNIQNVFDSLNMPKNLAPSNSGIEEFITLYEGNTRKAYADKLKSPSSKVESPEMEKLLAERGNEL